MVQVPAPQAPTLHASARQGPSAVQVLGLVGCGLVALLGGLVIAACVTGMVAIVRAIRRGPEGPAREEEVGES